jgi:hypothetical protein
MNVMKNTLFLTIAICLLLSPLASPAAIKCWTNKDGVRECGNTIPPEYAQQGSETINERGITVETHKRALTKEEAAKKEKQEAEEKRRAAEEEEKRKKQVNADRVLLSTFLSAEEIIGARDRKLTLIDGNIEITNVTIKKLNDDLQIQRKKAANYERKGKTVPARTLKEIASLERQIKNKDEFIQAKELEKQTIREKYARDLKRFREIKSQGMK